MRLINQKILLTGAAGFVGSNLLRHIYINYPFVKLYVFLRKDTDVWRINDLLPKINITYLSITDKEAVKKAILKIKPDIIFHLASYGAYPAQTDLVKMTETNILGLSNLLLALEQTNYKLFVNVGSSSEYGFKKHIMKESDYLEPNSQYAATKAASTLMANTFGLINHRPIITLRLFSVYGPYEEPSRLIPTIINRSLRNKKLSLVKNASVRDFIYIDDIISAFLSCLTLKNFDRRIFNICTGKQTSVKQITNLIVKLTGSKSKIHTGGYSNRSWDSGFWVGENLLAKKILKWRPKSSLEKGLLKTITWLNQNQKLYDNK